LTQIRLEARRETGAGKADPAVWHGGHVGEVRVVFDPCEKEYEDADRENPGTAEGDERKGTHHLLLPPPESAVTLNLAVACSLNIR
jgi:hypothetical protein